MKRHNFKLAAVLGLAICGIAFAAAPPASDLFRWVKGRINIGSTYVQANGITHTSVGCTAYDFPAIGDGTLVSKPICLDTWDITATGARPGDSCSPSSSFGADGGADVAASVNFFCRVTATNTIKVRACSFMSDSGTVDLADAGFCGRTFSNL